MPTLVTLMTVNAIIRQGRVQHLSGKHTIRHDKTIHDNYHTQLGSTQHTSHGSHHFETSKITDNIFRSSIPLVIFHTTLQHVIFVLNAFPRQSTPRPHAITQRNTRQVSHPHGRRRSIGYSHFPETHHVRT